MIKNIKCISFDGIDGSGKSTLIEELSKSYNIALIPKFYNFGFVPFDSDTRMK